MTSLVLRGAPAFELARGRVETSPRAVEFVRDAAWFSRLYEETVESVFRYALMTVHDADRAEDIAADAYLRAWSARETLRSETSALSWLLSITHNAAMSAVRKTREVCDLSLVSEPEDKSADPSAGLFADAELAAVQDAILKLTPEQQEVVFLRFFEGLSHDAIAARVGKKPNAVRAIQFRALVRLRALLGASHARS